MIRNLLAVAALAAAGVATAAAPASAACVGTTNTIVVCTEPTGSTLYSDCVYLGTEPCNDVSVPGPTVTCTKGPLLNRLDLTIDETLQLRDVDCNL